MKGKLAFVLGAAVGYVLGSRAGRERYEQIKRGARQVWRSDTVQRGVGVVREAVDERAEGVKAFASRVAGDVFSDLAKKNRSGGEGEAAPGRGAKDRAENGKKSGS
ncbi:YtxH domain-containing protein [Leucobacter weissii]|uniref:YtxH domain-containing protein n=1 Tax=Leucobacter weissii TaxID=1983706 RepID=UPI001FB636DD|nr:YtxH domain-containing protein [Leucobacter weissii]